MSSTNKFFRFFLFQRTPEPGLSAGRHRAFWLWNSLMLLCAAAGVTAVMLLLAPGDYRLAVFLGYFRHPLIFLANFLPIALLMLLGLAVTARPWAAYLFGAVPAMALAFGNYYKLAFRDDPVLFADLLILGEAGEMAGQYRLFLDWKLILALACILAGFLILFFLVRGRPNGRARIISAVAVLAAVLLGGRAYIGDGLYEATGTNLEYLNQWSSTHQHISRGSLYPFLYSINEAFPSPAEGYDEDEVADLLSQYQSAGIPEDEKVNIVGIMLEAFSDFSSFDGIEFAQDAYVVYHALEAESYTGNLVTNIFAGNTVNSERAFLTGMSTQYNWRGSTNSYVWYFKDQGYETWGDHPCYQWFYNRQNVNTYLGFDSYRFVENYYVQFNDGVSMDDVFFPELTAELLERMESDAPQFSFSVSYQGHGPYDDSVCEWGDVDDYIVNNDLDEASRNILANYLGSVMDTQEHLSELVDALRESDEPVVLIVFGDHKPWLGNGNSVYEALGVNLDTSTEEGFYNYWSTRYLIWANDAAKEALGFDFTGHGPDLSPSFLMGHLFDLLGWEGDAFTQAAAPVREELTVIHDSGACVSSDGTLTLSPSAEQQELIRLYHYLEYYRSRHFDY